MSDPIENTTENKPTVSDLELTIANGPRLCGVTGPNEKRWSNRFHGAFLDEILNASDIWKQAPGESIDSRLDILKGLYQAAGADQRKVSFWIGLITLRAHTHAIVEHGQTDLQSTKDSIVAILTPMEAQYPDFGQYMTVEAASTRSNWS